MPRPVALVSSADARQHDGDLHLIIRALADRGVVAEIIDWDDAAVDWGQFAAAVVRSPWDYHRRYDEFMAWVEHVSSLTLLLNDAETIRWNADKTYIAELADAKVPVIPTTFVRTAADLDAVEIPADCVVKPTVSAGSNNTERHTSAEDARTHIRALLDADKTAMVQPYQRFIDDNGETGMLFFDGEYSHAFRKGAILATGENVKNGLFVVEDIGPRKATDQEIELGEKVMATVRMRLGGDPLYARVDVVRGSAGTPVLMELELTEPSLYLAMDPNAATRFASALVARLR